MPKLSIITIAYNNLTGLQKTIDSVFSQTCRDFEHIIIDGGSQDGSKSYLKEVTNRAQKLNIQFQYVSEPDNGIYDAMNKGICKARGEYCLFLNSGDVLDNPRVLDDVALFSLESSIVCGDSIYEQSKYHDGHIVKSPDKIIASHLILSYLPHQSSFIRRDLFKKIHLYDVNFRVVSDWLFFIEALLIYKVSYKHISLIVSRCETEGISNNPANCQLMAKEFELGLKKIMPEYYDDYVELRQLRQEIIRPKYRFLKENEHSLWFKIIWKLYRIIKMK